MLFSPNHGRTSPRLFTRMVLCGSSSPVWQKVFCERYCRDGLNHHKATALWYSTFLGLFIASNPGNIGAVDTVILFFTEQEHWTAHGFGFRPVCADY